MENCRYPRRPSGDNRTIETMEFEMKSQAYAAKKRNCQGGKPADTYKHQPFKVHPYSIDDVDFDTLCLKCTQIEYQCLEDVFFGPNRTKEQRTAYRNI